MASKKGSKELNISNRLAYTLIAIFSVIFIGAGVYAAVTAGTTPNPGHSIQTIGAPVGCAVGQYLRYINDYSCSTQGITGPCWVCATPSTAGETFTLDGLALFKEISGQDAVCPSGYSAVQRYYTSETCVGSGEEYYCSGGSSTSCTTGSGWSASAPTCSYRGIAVTPHCPVVTLTCQSYSWTKVICEANKA
jgi:hypothetical protein